VEGWGGDLISRTILTWTEENHGKPRSEERVSRSRWMQFRFDTFVSSQYWRMYQIYLKSITSFSWDLMTKQFFIRTLYNVPKNIFKVSGTERIRKKTELKPYSSINFSSDSEYQFSSKFVHCLKIRYIWSSVFWDITPCRLLELNRCFGGTCRLHLQGWILN
jgi:hypothetical protein